MIKYSARKLTISPVELKKADSFFREFHRQGTLATQLTTVNLGLFDGEELLGVAQFGSPRTARMKRDYSFELLRMAFRGEIRVMGGASKLINHFIREYKPADLFTYQDTSGEATAVYEHAGMTLVSQAKKKQYLVAPGKTLATGSRKEVLGMPYATRYGPDRILGTKLGEVFREDGSRKGNKELFLEELGWHLEETSGDRVYEWRNLNRTYYTYKINAADSDKYYYGVSHVKKANATVEDCLNDGYFGSGGQGKNNKFSNWKKRHGDSLQKEVLSRHDTSRVAYKKEKDLIGDLWRTDPKSLNSTPGGKFGGLLPGVRGISLRLCEIHGETKFVGESCFRCSAAKSWTTGFCEVHGETKIHGGSCAKCKTTKSIKSGFCELHGETKFSGNSCRKCAIATRTIQKKCLIHGLTTHSGENCYKCFMVKAEESECAVHGVTLHKSGVCLKCQARARLTEGECPSHGEVIYQNGKCAKCLANERESLRVCPTHGLVSHTGSSCRTCVSNSAMSEKECDRHGLAKHRGTKCYKCIQEKTTHSRYHKLMKKEGCIFCFGGVSS